MIDRIQVFKDLIRNRLRYNIALHNAHKTVHYKSKHLKGRVEGACPRDDGTLRYVTPGVSARGHSISISISISISNKQ